MAGIRTVREPLILFGEGPTEGLFLSLFKQHYSRELAKKQIIPDSGNGGSAGSVLLELKKKRLDTGNAKTPALVLIDEDKGLDETAEEVLQAHPNIQIVFSRPECLEGLLLDLKDDLPPPGQQRTDNLKKCFQDKYLRTRAQVQKNFKAKRHALFPKELLESKRSAIPAIHSIYQFLGINQS